MGTKKYTTAKDDIGATGLTTWNEHLFFEPKNVVSILYIPAVSHNYSVYNRAKKRLSTVILLLES